MRVEPRPLDKFHRVKDAAVRQRAHIVNRNNSRVLQAREDLRLTNQAPFQFSAAIRGVQYFESHAAIELLVPSRIDNAHAASGYAFE